MGKLLGPPHGTTPAAVIANHKLRSIKSSEHINEKGIGPFRGLNIDKRWRLVKRLK